mgnify:CR=1 FL=1
MLNVQVALPEAATSVRWKVRVCSPCHVTMNIEHSSEIVRLMRLVSKPSPELMKIISDNSNSLRCCRPMGCTDAAWLLTVDPFAKAIRVILPHGASALRTPCTTCECPEFLDQTMTLIDSVPSGVGTRWFQSPSSQRLCACETEP